MHCVIKFVTFICCKYSVLWGLSFSRRKNLQSRLVLTPAMYSKHNLTVIDGVLFKCGNCVPFFYVCYAYMLEDHQLRPNHIAEKWNVSC